MRRLLASCALTVGLFAGLSLSAQETPTPSWTCPEDVAGQTLHMANWSTYIAPDTVSNFEALCNVTVDYVEFNDDKEILTTLRQGASTYDLIIPDNSTVGIMIEEGLLEELDHANLPNLEHIDPQFESAAYDVGNVYSVPYQWGTVGVGYLKSEFPTPPTSWNDVFDYEGPTVWLDYGRPLIGIALLITGHDPASSDADNIADARNFLINHSHHVTLKPDNEAQDALLNGDAFLVIEHSGDILQLTAACECDEIGYVIPEEGSNIWVDSMVIPVDAENKRLAEAFIDYVLDPAVSASISNATSFATPNKTAIDEKLVDEALLSNRAIYPFEDLREKMFFLSVLTPDETILYDDAWREIQMLAGK